MGFPSFIPEEYIEKAMKLGVFWEDCEESFVRGSGSGGQKINKTSSCVQLRHLPSGVEVRCQKHRERERNRLSALKLLLRKIEQIRLGKLSEIDRKIHKIKKQKQKRSKRAQAKVVDQKVGRGAIKKLRKPLGVKDL